MTPNRHTFASHNPLSQRGFTLIELMLASVILLVGIVAVAQLVPASILSNATNRNDSSAMVFGQRLLNQLSSQPLSSNTFADPTAGAPCDISVAICNLGNPAQPNQTVGSPVIPDFNNRPVINFSAAQVPGYFVNYADLNDPYGTTYDVRWAVITTVNNGAVFSKRFILGVTKRGGNGFYAPVTLDTMVQR
jgi:prepilin-type N-terminal cleavage/methylation domain-containing protein